MGCLIGLDEIPGLLTVLGTFVVSLGLYYIVMGNDKERKAKPEKN